MTTRDPVRLTRVRPHRPDIGSAAALMNASAWNPIIWDWIGFAVRWIHLITGIAWIGASFYFIHLDASLRRSAACRPASAGKHGR